MNDHFLQAPLFNLELCKNRVGLANRTGPLPNRSGPRVTKPRMVTGHYQENGEKNPKGAIRSLGTALSGQSVSTSGSAGSPSSQSEAGMASSAHENSVLRLSHLEIQGENVGSQGTVSSKKKKRGQRATGADKSDRGLRQFSRKVCDKVESKGRTTYSEVADELVAEYADASNALGSDDQPGDADKNIRRRVYDALNVLMAMDIISKDKKEIQWKGLPRSSLDDIEELKTERIELKNRIEKKAAYLKELEDQFVGYQNLIQRNRQVYGNGNTPSGGVALPFILVQTRPNATVEVEISEDMQLVHFDFSSTPFELHDDNYVLKQMRCFEKSQFDCQVGNPLSNTEGLSIPSTYHQEIAELPKPCEPQVPTMGLPSNSVLLSSSVSSTPTKTSTSLPLPGILKARAQHDR